MSATVVQYVFKPNPGANLQELLALIKEAAEMWRKHGADVSLWNVQVGEVGNMTFVVRCESASQLGTTLDALRACSHCFRGREGLSRRANQGAGRRAC